MNLILTTVPFLLLVNIAVRFAQK